MASIVLTVSRGVLLWVAVTTAIAILWTAPYYSPLQISSFIGSIFAAIYLFVTTAQERLESTTLLDITWVGLALGVFVASGVMGWQQGASEVGKILLVIYVAAFATASGYKVRAVLSTKK